MCESVCIFTGDHIHRREKPRTYSLSTQDSSAADVKEWHEPKQKTSRELRLVAGTPPDSGYAFVFEKKNEPQNKLTLRIAAWGSQLEEPNWPFPSLACVGWTALGWA